MQLYTKILIGLVAGAVVGLVANLTDIGWLRQTLVSLELVGTAFIRLITMIVIPLVVASLMVGTASLGDIRKLGRIGSKTLVYYLLTTAIAVSIGLGVSNLFQPGSSVDPETRDQLAAQFESEAAGKMQLAAESPSLKDVLLNLIPRNPVQAAAEFDLLPLIFFSVVFGAAVSLLPREQKGTVMSFFEGVNGASMIVIGWVMKLAPYAVFALIGSIVAQFGLDLLRSLLIYSLVVILGLLLHMFGTISVMVRLAAGLNPISFFRRIVAAPIFGFSTSSSSATLPVTMRDGGRKARRLQASQQFRTAARSYYQHGWHGLVSSRGRHVHRPNLQHPARSQRSVDCRVDRNAGVHRHSGCTQRGHHHADCRFAVDRPWRQSRSGDRSDPRGGPHSRYAPHVGQCDGRPFLLRVYRTFRRRETGPRGGLKAQRP